jgi:uncharacterized protein
MPSGTYYVYALLDPRTSPPKPFYIGKGHGSRAYAHLVEDGESRKVRRIREIRAAGVEVVVKQLVGELSEADALRVEAQLIAAHGTIETGGQLLNRVVPTGEAGARTVDVTIPDGSIEKAQLGLGLLKQAILELAAVNPSGITNADAVLALGLQSDHKGEQRNYLSWSVLGILMREGRVRKVSGAAPRDSRYEFVKVGESLE